MILSTPSVQICNFGANRHSGTILGITGADGIGFLLSGRIAACKRDETRSITVRFCSIADGARINPGNQATWRVSLHRFIYRAAQY